MPDWQIPWLVATSVLLPLRLAMVAEVSEQLLKPMKERLVVVAALLCSCGIVAVILGHYVPLGVDFYSFVAARQYLQIMAAAWMGLLLLYAGLRPGFRFDWHGFIVAVAISDYAIAATFEETVGLSNGFIFSTPALRASVKAVSSFILALCFIAWAATPYRKPEQKSGEPSENQHGDAAHPRHS